MAALTRPAQFSDNTADRRPALAREGEQVGHHARRRRAVAVRPAAHGAIRHAKRMRQLGLPARAIKRLANAGEGGRRRHYAAQLSVVPHARRRGPADKPYSAAIDRLRRIKKIKLPALNLPRKYSRLPRIGKPRNPFKAGTSATRKRVKRAIATHTAALAANQVPGKAIAAGALGAKLAGPAGAAAAFSATEAASVGASALLARSIARRGKVAAYLSRRSKRKTGVYKAGEAGVESIDALYDAIAKAGLIRPGKPPLLKRVAFLLASGSSDRKYRIGRYLEGRKRGKLIPGTRRPRRGTYTGVYATGVNKSRGFDRFKRTVIHQGRAYKVDAPEPFRTALKQSGDLLEAARMARKKLRKPRKTPVKKEASMDAIEELYEAIEKAKGLIRGGSKRTMRVFQRRAKEGKVSGKGKTYAFRSGYLSTRVKGGSTGQGPRDHPSGGKAYRTLTRSGKYK